MSEPSTPWVDVRPQTEGGSRTEGSRPTARRLATEARLLDAAEQTFAAQGFEAAGVKEIAERAGANVALINRYFGGKQGLLYAICERFMGRKARDELTYPPQESLADEVYEYLHHRLREDREHGAVVRLMVSRITIDDAFREHATRTFTTQADENFRARIEALQEAGMVDDGANIDTLFTTVSFFSFSTNLFGALIQERPADEIDELFAEFAGLIGRGVARG